MKILNFINGKYVEPLTGQYLDNFNPATGKVYSQVANSGPGDVDAAVDAAQKALPKWSQMTVTERGRYLMRLSQFIHDNLNKLAEAESIDQGKPITNAKKIDIPRCSRNFEFYVDMAKDFKGERFQSKEHGDNRIVHSPLGVVACISPWNLPLYLLTWKIAPALIMGNTVIAKPSEVTPMTASLLGELINKAEIPPGVINIIQGSGASVGNAINSHPGIKAVSFTGSTATGRVINQQAAGSFKKVSLEMGGKNPNIIFADCDFEKTIENTMRSTFMNQGEVCTCGSRIFVEKPIYEKFRDALVARAKALKVGNPLDPATEQGALVSKEHMQKVLSYIDLAKQEGGRLLCGGERANLPGENAEGYFVMPTLFENLNTDSRTNQEEIFGPMATIQPFTSVDEVIKAANSTSYGLSATIHTKDQEKAVEVARQIEAGVVWINSWMVRDLRAPFGGWKNSGLGREGGFYSLKFFSEVKNILIPQ